MENSNQTLTSDLEMGYHGEGHRHRMFYVRDFTYRVVPLCIMILVVFSDGAILVCTLAFDKPIPKKGVIVISAMLAVLLFLFSIGWLYIYHRKHYPDGFRGLIEDDLDGNGRTSWAANERFAFADGLMATQASPIGYVSVISASEMMNVSH